MNWPFSGRQLDFEVASKNWKDNLLPLPTPLGRVYYSGMDHWNGILQIFHTEILVHTKYS